MRNFFTLDLWFSMYPGKLAPVFQYILIGLVTAFIVLLIAAALQYRRNKKNLYAKFWNSVYNFSLTGVIIGACLFLFTYERVPFLGMRFWFLVWALIHLIWLYFLVKKYHRIPEIERELEQKREFKKYIP